MDKIKKVKTVSALIQNIATKQVIGNAEMPVGALTLDSRKASNGTLFFAQKGTHTDGHNFIESVINAGACAIVCEQLPDSIKDGVCYVQVENTIEVTGHIAANFYNNPTQQLKVIGVTGTNGKTTIATLLFKLFTKLGYNCGLISTVANYINNTIIPATHTTPDAVSLQGLFAQMKEEGCTHVFMEVSSHAIHQQRINGVHFDGGIFSNITHDHLDYHNTFDEYIRVKKAFFDNLPKTSFALTNIDDKRGMVMLQNTKATKKTYALKMPADYKAKVLENGLEGLMMTIDGQDVHFRLTGLFNAYNLLAVYGTAILCGEEKHQVLTELSAISGVNGRFETTRSTHTGVLGIVDYAHTPDALHNVLTTIKQFSGERRIITVVGCGGDRDKAKRPIMANVAAELSDKVILTSDNPRSENPEDILNQMEAGLNLTQKRKALRISDRKEAIKVAVTFAEDGDVVLVAGKGHENYQEINGVKNHFDDKEVITEMFQLLNK